MASFGEVGMDVGMGVGMGRAGIDRSDNAEQRQNNVWYMATCNVISIQKVVKHNNIEGH
jgi:hypothetical protein